MDMLSSSAIQERTSQGTSPTLEKEPVALGADLTASPQSGSSNATTLVRIPRYVPVPPCILRTRKRYPHVCRTLYLECCRCRQWVAVEVAPQGPPPEASAFVEVDTSRSEQNRRLAERWEAFRKGVLALNTGGDASAGTEDGRRRRSGSSRGPAASSSGAVDGKAVAPCRFVSPRLRAILEQSEKAKAEARQEGTCASCGSGSGSGNSTVSQNSENPSSASSQAKKKNKNQTEEKYYMPNPLVFHCKWHLCEKEDQLAHLRAYWLRDLYGSVARQQLRQMKKNKSGVEETTDSSQKESGCPFADVAQFREALNHNLAMELDVKRSERIKSSSSDVMQFGDTTIAPTPSPSSPLNGTTKKTHHSESMSYEKLDELRLLAKKFSFENDEANRRLHQAWLHTAAHHLLHEGGKDAILSSFCWASCASCGKRRRLAQPHPGGGAPFLCCLQPSVGGCHVSELEGLVQYTTAYVGQRLERVALSSPCLPPPLKEVYASQRGQWWTALLREERSRVSATTTDDGKHAAKREATEKSPAELEESMRQYLLRLLLQDSFITEVQEAVRHKLIADAGGGAAPSKRRERGKNGTSLTPQQALLPITPFLPQIYEVAAAVKQKSQGSFVHYLMLTPQQVREKRETILRESLLQDHHVSSQEGIVDGGATRRPGRKKGATTAAQQVSASPDAVAPSSAKREEGVDKEEEESNGRKDKKKKRIKVEAVEEAQKPTRPKKETVLQRKKRKQQEREERKLAKVQRVLAKAAHTAAATPVESELKVKGKRGRKQKEETKPASTAAEKTEEEEVLHWVQCDKCDKWRIVQEAIPKHVTYWECRMRPSTTCADPDDADLDVY